MELWIYPLRTATCSQLQLSWLFTGVSGACHRVCEAGKGDRYTPGSTNIAMNKWTLSLQECTYNIIQSFTMVGSSWILTLCISLERYSKEWSSPHGEGHERRQAWELGVVSWKLRFAAYDVHMRWTFWFCWCQSVAAQARIKQPLAMAAETIGVSVKVSCCYCDIFLDLQSTYSISASLGNVCGTLWLLPGKPIFSRQWS